MIFTFTDAVITACTAHSGKRDKGGEDYIKHPLHVAYKLRDKGYSNETQMAGVLHDVIEDSQITIEELRRKGCPESICNALGLLTHVVDTTYIEDTIITWQQEAIFQNGDSALRCELSEEYLRQAKIKEYLRYVERIKQNTIARVVKIEDLLHNSDIRRIPPDKFDTPEKAMSMQERLWKYATALKILY